jgi:hypothetical protein
MWQCPAAARRYSWAAHLNQFVIPRRESLAQASATDVVRFLAMIRSTLTGHDVALGAKGMSCGLN